MSNLKWREASKELSPSALLIYLLIQEEGGKAMRPTDIEKTGLMSKSTASRGIKELQAAGYLNKDKELTDK